MSLSYIPNQPVYFIEYGSEQNECCPNNYVSLANQSDNFSVQLLIDACYTTQLFDNPNFTDGTDGLDGWDKAVAAPPLGGLPPSVIDGQLNLTEYSTVSQDGFTPYDNYLVEINVTSVVNGINIIGANEAIINELGVHSVIVQASAIGEISISTFFGATIAYARCYLGASASNYTVEVFSTGADPSTATPVHTVTGQTLNVTSDILSLNFIWNSFGIDEGCYFISISYDCGDGDVYMVSNDFNLQESHECTKQIFACLGQDAFGFDNATFFPSLRFVGNFEKNRYPNSRTLYRDTAGLTTIYHADIEKVKDLETDLVPEWIQDWFGTLPAYANIEIDNQSWTVDEESIDPDPSDEIPSLATININMKRNNTPLIKALCEETISCSTPPPNCIIWNDGENIDWNNGECIEFNN